MSREHEKKIKHNLESKLELTGTDGQISKQITRDINTEMETGDVITGLFSIPRERGINV